MSIYFKSNPQLMESNKKESDTQTPSSPRTLSTEAAPPPSPQRAALGGNRGNPPLCAAAARALNERHEVQNPGAYG